MRQGRAGRQAADGGTFVAPAGRAWPASPAQVAPFQRETRRRLRQLLGEIPFAAPPPLNTEVTETHDDGDLWRHKLRYGDPTDDVVWAWLLVPKAARAPLPAVICLAGSFMTPNWAKDAPAGLAGPLTPGDPEAYGRDLARLGFVTLCPDHPCCGQRTPPGRRSHDTESLDARFPGWSRVGLSAWDVSRAVDVLRSRPEVDGGRIATCGWSQGGQMALIGAALDERLVGAVSICGWGPWRGVGGDRARNWARSYNFPRLAPHLSPASGRATPLPLDFDDIVAAVAPRPVLDVRAAQDATFPNRAEQAAAVDDLARLWALCGAAEGFRAVEVPGEHAHGVAAARQERDWLRRWLGA